MNCAFSQDAFYDWYIFQFFRNVLRECFMKTHLCSIEITTSKKLVKTTACHHHEINEVTLKHFFCYF